VTGAPVPRAWLAGDAPEVAPRLLGLVLQAGDVSGRIVEVEAYTADDPASHSARGRTARNAAMFERAGTLYVYLIYGMHHCANVVTGRCGDGQAVLVRALEPLDGIDLMASRRGGRRPLAGGPGTLCQALAIDRRHDGVDLCSADSPVVLRRSEVPAGHRIVTGPRVGIAKAVERPWRWRLLPEATARTH
jgi:DNA-3-methyladenine glycosylase